MLRQLDIKVRKADTDGGREGERERERISY